jgi:hypothetical protein
MTTKTTMTKTAAPAPKSPARTHVPLTMSAVGKLLKRRQIQADPGNYELYDALLAMHAELCAMHERVEQTERLANSMAVEVQKLKRHSR